MSNGRGWGNRALNGRISRRRTLALTGAAAFIAACGGGGNDGDDADDRGASSATGAQPTTTAVQSEGTPKVGGTYTWSDVGDTPIDPTNNPTYRAQTISGYTYGRLLKFKTGPTPDTAYNYEVMPDLAASHEFSNDGLQLTFKLQPTAKFINKPPVNGHAVEAADVKASFERFQTAPKNTNKNAFGSPTNRIVDTIETPDAKTVVVKLARPYAPILNLFGNSQYLWIMPRETDAGFDPSKEAIGSGPWMIQSIEPDKAITLKRNPDYFVQGTPYIDTVIRAVIPETAQRIAQLQAGRLDQYDVPAQSKVEVAQSNPKFQIIPYIPTTYSFISPQQREGSPFRDVRLRRALSYAVDRKSLFDLVYIEGMHVTSAVPASMGKWWLNPVGQDAGPGGEYFKYDPKAARDLLKAAGMENMPLRYIFTNNAYGDTFNQSAEAVAGMLKESGFNTSILTQDYLREYIDAKGAFFGNYEGVFYGLQTPFTDPHDYLFNMNHPSSARNHAGIDDPRLTQMIDDEERTIDEAARVKKVQDIQRYWMEQMYYVPMVVGYAYSFVQPWVKRWYYSSTYGFAAESLINSWVDKV
ncbi:MAG: ABC transporter substrate-binding protein [Dehalococcoidia bacterium]